MSDWRDRLEAFLRRENRPEVSSAFTIISGAHITITSKGVNFRVLKDNVIQVILPLRRDLRVSLSQFAEGIQIGAEHLGSAKFLVDGKQVKDFGTLKKKAVIHLGGKAEISFQLE